VPGRGYRAAFEDILLPSLPSITLESVTISLAPFGKWSVIMWSPDRRQPLKGHAGQTSWPGLLASSETVFLSQPIC